MSNAHYLTTSDKEGNISPWLTSFLHKILQTTFLKSRPKNVTKRDIGKALLQSDGVASRGTCYHTAHPSEFQTGSSYCLSQQGWRVLYRRLSAGEAFAHSRNSWAIMTRINIVLKRAQLSHPSPTIVIGTRFLCTMRGEVCKEQKGGFHPPTFNPDSLIYKLID